MQGTGRPKIKVSKEQLEFLLSYRFTAHDIGVTIGCSVRTVHCCLSEHGLSVGQFYINISDEDLEEVVSQINQRYPRHGYRMVEGHLLRLGIQARQRDVTASVELIQREFHSGGRT